MELENCSQENLVACGKIKDRFNLRLNQLNFANLNWVPYSTRDVDMLQLFLDFRWKKCEGANRCGGSAKEGGWGWGVVREGKETVFMHSWKKGEFSSQNQTFWEYFS